MHAQPLTDQSHIAEARRYAVDAAEKFGFDTTQAGRVAIVATELGTNVLRHGGGGELLIGSYDDPSGAGIELIALDKGRGIANLEAALQDGFSSAGSSGHGLGAIRRQSQVMDIASWPDIGTVVLARLDSKERTPTQPSAWGFVSLPIAGETVCGDACAAEDTENGRTFIVADGLGHGPDAAIAANEALRLFRRHQARSVPELLEYLHGGLRPTRGAAIAIARFDHGAAKIVYGGIGNISGAIIDGPDVRRMVSLNGTAGHTARKIQTFDYPYRKGSVVMVSDGIGSNWSFARYPGIGTHHPTVQAAVLYRDFTRHRDDVTVLVGHGVEQ